MSEDARRELEDAKGIAREWDDHRRVTTVRANQLAAKGMALQQAGLIPLHTDPEWILESLEQAPMESLRLKGTDER